MTYYSTPFSVTSQFAFCGLPLRLDTYRGCGFRCSYCFARQRGGNLPGDAIRPANPLRIRRIFHRALVAGRPGVIAEFLRRRVPIHLGGMSDPLQPVEQKFHVTAAVLRTLIEHRYPTVLSTRSLLVAQPPYLDLLQELGLVVVQFSFSSLRDEIAQKVEPFSTPPSLLLRTMETLSRRGLIVTCRWQPYIPGLSEPPADFVPQIASTGCRHLALEHLKVPIERSNALWGDFTYAAGRDFVAEYKLAGARRDGREWVLNSEQKLATILAVRRLVLESGMTFGAADNEFQYLSSTGCCCSGVDQFPGFENWFRHQIGFAVRQGVHSQPCYSTLQNEWTPAGSIDRFLNSHSRIATAGPITGTIRDHVQARWNRADSPGSPGTFYGIVRESSPKDSPPGCARYAWDPQRLKSLT